MRGDKRFLLPLLLAFLLIAGGCSLGFDSVESLMRAPKLTGSNASIQDAFEKEVGADVTLQSPRSGKYRSAYVLYDFDGDAQEEALVFYTSPQDELTVHIHFLDCIDGEWVSVGDEVGKESVVYELVFCDMNNDDVSEIMICYDSKRSNRIMSVYRVSVETEEKPMQVASLSTVQYSDYMCLDMDHDGETEIFYTVFEASAETAVAIPFARVLKFYEDADGARIDLATSLAMNPAITAFKACSYDMERGLTRVYMDCLYSNAQIYVTEVLLWQAPQGYSLPLEKAGENQLALTSRITELYATDIDGDMLMDIPSERELPLTEILNMPEGIIVSAACRTWYRCSPDGMLTPVKSRYIDPQKRFSLDLLAASLYGNASVSYDCTYGKTTFYSYYPEIQARGEALFSMWFATIQPQTVTDTPYFDITPAGQEAGFTEESIASLLTLTQTED